MNFKVSKRIKGVVFSVIVANLWNVHTWGQAITLWITATPSCLQPERAGRRHSFGSRAGSQPPESQLVMNRQDYFVLENLVQRQRTEAMKTQGLELVRLLRVSAIT